MATLRYLFDMHCGDRDIVTEYAGELAAGSRIHISYSGGTISTDEKEFAKAWPKVFEVIGARGRRTFPERVSDYLRTKTADGQWFGIEGRIASGADWAMVRKDAVVTFDTRVTLKANPSNGNGNGNGNGNRRYTGFLIDALFSGNVDLGAEPVESLARANQIYNQWKEGQLPSVKLPIAFGVRFEASGEPSPDAANRYTAQVADYSRYIRLTRRQCVALGTLEVQPGTRYHPITRLDVTVYENGN